MGRPTAPYGHPEQPPPKEYPIPKQTRCLRSLPGSRTGHTNAATQTHRSGTGEAMGIGGAAAEKVGTALPITVVTAASMNGATAENRERKQVSAFMFACRWLYEPRCAHVGGRARAHLRSRRRSCRPAQDDPPSPPVPAGEDGAHSRNGQGLTLESAHPLRSASASRSLRNGNRVACARARARELSNGRAKHSSSCEDRDEMRHALGRARVKGCAHHVLHGFQTFARRGTPCECSAASSRRMVTCKRWACG